MNDEFNLSSLGDDVLARLEQHDDDMQGMDYTSPDSDAFIIHTLDGLLQEDYLSE